MAAFQFDLQSGRIKVGWVGNDDHVGFGKKKIVKREAWDDALS
jgi:hypothetical protein